MAKIAVELSTDATGNGSAGYGGSRLKSRVLGRGDGWEVVDVVCSAGPSDRPFEERHACFNVALVVAGTFQYRGDGGCELMTPGSIFLGNEGQGFECGHQHGTGDRCLSFQFSAEYFGRLAADVGGRGIGARFRMLRLPPLREFSRLAARACAGLAAGAGVEWEELSLEVAAKAVRTAQTFSSSAKANPLPSTLSRMTRVARMMENERGGDLSLGSLAAKAGLSPYHFLRSFEQMTGLTPHQYVRRARLREAAVRLALGERKVVDVALESGFGDVSNFNRAFKSEFGANPSAYRLKAIG